MPNYTSKGINSAPACSTELSPPPGTWLGVQEHILYCLLKDISLEEQVRNVNIHDAGSGNKIPILQGMSAVLSQHLWRWPNPTGINQGEYCSKAMVRYEICQG